MTHESRQLRTLGSTITSMILGAAETDEAHRRHQMERFIRSYGAPLRAHLIYRRRIPEDKADDWLNDFFLEKLLCIDPQHGLVWKYLEKKKTTPALRFRSYLLAALNFFVIDMIRRDRRQLISLNVNSVEPADDSPELHDRFDVDWANNLLHQALTAVQLECTTHNQQDIWDVFELRIVRPALQGSVPPSYDELVTRLGFHSPKQASNRLQTAVRKFNRLIRELVVNYLPVSGDAISDADIEQEINDLRLILSAPGAMQSSNDEHLVGESTLSSTSPLLFDIDDTADVLWQSADLKQMWQHVLRMPIEDILRESNRQLADTYADISILNGTPLRNLGDLWQHPSPPLDLLQAIKNEAKASAKQANSPVSRNWTSDRPLLRHCVPSSFNTVLYQASIAAACLRLNTRITRDSDSKFKTRLEIALAMPWLDAITRQLLEQWLEHIDAKT